MKTPTHKQIRDLVVAGGKLREGELEMDPGAKVSAGDDNGAYVQVWLWVDFSGTPFDKEKPV